mmetsp:Transcript_153900/g.271725  ORF Transcript_153900/g.271725 Transcript_153900/m.271725 type:complete len:223 (-) Transcript_153900:182-850(-)
MIGHALEDQRLALGDMCSTFRLPSCGKAMWVACQCCNIDACTNKSFVRKRFIGSLRVQLLELPLDRRSQTKFYNKPTLRKPRFDVIKDFVYLLQTRNLRMRHRVKAVSPCDASRILPEKQHLHRRQMLSLVRMNPNALWDRRDLQIRHFRPFVKACGGCCLVELYPKLLLDMLHEDLHHRPEVFVHLGLEFVGHLHHTRQVARHRDDQSATFKVSLRSKDGV